MLITHNGNCVRRGHVTWLESSDHFTTYFYAQSSWSLTYTYFLFKKQKLKQNDNKKEVGLFHVNSQKSLSLKISQKRFLCSITQTGSNSSPSCCAHWNWPFCGGASLWWAAFTMPGSWGYFAFLFTLLFKWPYNFFQMLTKQNLQVIKEMEKNKQISKPEFLILQ